VKETLDTLTKTLEHLLLDAAPQLDGATDCLTCAEAAVALQSRPAAIAVLARIDEIAGQDFRFRAQAEFLVIRDLAMAARKIHDGFPA
jgi:hypothetical protein